VLLIGFQRYKTGDKQALPAYNSKLVQTPEFSELK